MSNTLLRDLKDVLQFVQDSDGRFLSTSCEIKRSKEGGLGVFANRSLNPETTLLRIPKSSVFTANNSSIANLLFESEIDGILALNIAFIYELFVFGERSHWFKYLKSIQHKNNGSLYLPPSYYSKDLKLLLKGTALDVIFEGLDEQEEIREGFETACELAHHWNQESEIPIPYLFDFGNSESAIANAMFKEFAAIAFAISSRVFELDNFHGFGLVPIADLFNHHPCQPNVRFESNYDVCDKCGELGDCRHIIAEIKLLDLSTQMPLKSEKITGVVDKKLIEKLERELESDAESEEEPENSSTSKDEGDALSDDSLLIDHINPDECVDIVLATPIEEGEEIFNSYGDHSNSYLLAKYGFCVGDNPFDIVDLSEQILEFGRQNPKVLGPRMDWWQEEGHILYRNWYESCRREEDDESASESGIEFEEDISDAESRSKNQLESADDAISDAEDEDEDEDEDPWSEIYLDNFGKPSEVLITILNLLSLSKKQFSNFIVDSRDTTKIFNKMTMLENQSSAKSKKLLRQICRLKKYSTSKTISNISNSDESYILSQIKILISSEKRILKLVLDGAHK